MSKKMWHKIFKSKAQKQQQQLNKINKRHSRGIYEEYQQLSELLNGEKSPAARFSIENENENSHSCSSSSSSSGSASGNINVFEQQPQQSSFNSLVISEAQQQQPQQQQQSPQLSTFSRVRNTFSLRRKSNNNNNNNNNNKSSNNLNSSQKQSPNAKSSESGTPTPTPTAAGGGGQLQHVLIIVNQIDVAAATTTAATTNTATNSAQPLHVKPATTPTTTATTINSTKMDSNGVEDDEPVGPPPGPLTTGLSETILEEGAVSTDLTPCPNCSRTFNTNALRKHIAVCEKMLKKRKVFDSSRQRREGTSLSTYVLPKNFGLPNAEKAPGVHTPPQASREASTVSQEETAVSTRRKVKEKTRTPLRKGGGATASAASVADPAPAAAAAAAVTPAAAASAAAPSAMSRDRNRTSDRSIAKRVKDSASEHCPHCERNFNAKAFDRHVEWCKEKAIQANIKANNNAETNKAKERMEARKQYRPPNLKTKRAINRDKYSGAQEEQCEPEIVSPKSNQMSLSAMTTSVQSDILQRNAPPQTAMVQRPGTPEIYQERRQPRATRCQRDKGYEMEDAVELVRHGATDDAMQVAQLDCVKAAPLQPARSRRSLSQRQKIEVAESMAGPPQVPMTFEELNGLIKCQGAANICNIKMDIEEQELKIAPKIRSSTSLVRQVRRRIRTHEIPSIQMNAVGSDVEAACFASDNEEEISSHIKVEAHATRTVCRPKKRAQLPAISNTEPMRALPMPENKQKLEAVNQNTLPPIQRVKRHFKEDYDDDLSDEGDEEDYDEADKEVDQVLRNDKLLKNELDAGAISRDDDVEELQQLPKQLSQPVHRSPSNVSRLRSLPQQVKERSSRMEKTPSSAVDIKPERLPPNSTRTLVSSGHNTPASDKYDPFLSAKRQLEELCSPNTPPDNEPLVHTPAPPLMSTSLTSTLGKSHATTPTATATGTPTATTTSAAPKTMTSTTSNFRRTSSLRAPRRTPLLPSRPLFATNYRPTIQRGLSDEGPISSNFLKPEEYDEMPVRAACVNDFHSPRVVRRDTSASNRKQQLALPLGGGNEAANGTSSASNQTPAPTRNVAKTDSLAVFLKYEHELEQLNAKAAAEVDANVSKELSIKELKDKSNNLSKQNSAKNLTANANCGQLPPLTTPICPSAAKENIENVAHNFATPLRLEPIGKPVPSLITLNNNNNSNSSSSNNNNNNSNNKNGGNAAPLPIKLETIFGNSRLGDYIDPKLINPCDNLHIQQQSSTGSSDASSTPQQLPQSRSSSQSTITVMGQEQRRHSGEARNLLKRKMRLGRNQFLYDASPEEAYISSGSCADDEANRSSLEFDEQCWQQQQKQLLSNPLKTMPALPAMPNMPVLPTFDDFDFEEFLSSFENENDDEQFPLFRDCREFLLNRTTSRQRSFQKATSTPQAPAQSPQTLNQAQTAPTTASNQMTKTTTTATHRPATTGTSSQFITQPKIHYYDPARRSDSNMSVSSDSVKSTQRSNNSYKTPNSSGSCKSPHNSSYKTPVSSSEEKLQRQQSNESSSKMHSENDQMSAEESQKREIFISIETETNAQGRSPISPDSLRHMVGNAQTPIDVLHIENGNEPEHAKFSKISDNEEQPAAGHHAHVRYRKRVNSSGCNEGPSQSPLPTLDVEANNAKNVIDNFRNDFQQLGEEIGASVRREIKQRQDQLQHKQQMLTSQPHEHKVATPSPSVDSDELSSLDGYPMSSSQSSRQGTSFKLSADSTYGSRSPPYFQSHQKSSELQANSNARQSQMRPHTASGALVMSMKQASSMMDASTQAQTNYGTLKARQLMFPGNTPGAGDCVEMQHQQLPRQDSNYNQQVNAMNLKNNNNGGLGCNIESTNSQHSLHSNNSNASSTISSSSMKMSKFCHECGAKFVIEHAKFCMDCGVRRVVL